MAFTVYDKQGVKRIVHHPVDVSEALGTGNFFLEDPTKVANPKVVLEPDLKPPISMELSDDLKAEIPSVSDTAAGAKTASSRRLSSRG